MFYKMLSIFIKIPLCPQLRYKKFQARQISLKMLCYGILEFLFLWQKAHQALLALHNFLLIKINISSKLVQKCKFILRNIFSSKIAKLAKLLKNFLNKHILTLI